MRLLDGSAAQHVADSVAWLIKLWYYKKRWELGQAEDGHQDNIPNRSLPRVFPVAQTVCLFID